MRRLSVPLPLLLALAVPGTASATGRSAQPLVDLAPQQTAFRDHVGPATRAQARAAGDSLAVAYRTADGQTVSVRFSKSYTPDAAIAQTYVDFLGRLPHGTELSRLKMYIATPQEVQAYCGGQDGTLACYDPSVSRMTVPGEQTADDGSGVTSSYVIAHEYGHHIARYRNNMPFPALSFGPKYWASLERVCLHTINGRFVPGDEGERYRDNPGEAWADTFAHLTYPAVRWQFTPLLKPTKASRAAALKDVLTPWTKPVTTVFRGRFERGGPRTQVFQVQLRLDGALTIKLAGPRDTNFDIAVTSMGHHEGETSGPHSTDRYQVMYACREVDSERVNIKIRRRHGFGAFSATVTYAG